MTTNGKRTVETNAVAIGGGHGLATTSAMRSYATSITAIVSVADDGGSSGRLRRQLGIVPPGDLRTCLVALADMDDPHTAVLSAAFEHRFDADELAGHALGNLVLAALITATGDLQEALDEAGRMLSATGRVVPASAEAVVLKATAEGGEIEGQTAVMSTKGIRKISLVPADAPAPALAVKAIAHAQQVVMGPGSLYTSVLAALAVPQITEALHRSPARRIYVANLRPQPGETEGYDVSDHVRALSAHGVPVDTVLMDCSGIAVGDLAELGVEVLEVPLAKSNGLAHDPGRLAAALADLVG